MIGQYGNIAFIICRSWDTNLEKEKELTRLGDLIDMGYPITKCLSFTGKDINIHINDYQIGHLFAS